jgi:4a-hydroxytetrahydrobiopterin dehydratase
VTMLSKDEIRTALAALSDWRLVDNALVHDVAVPADSQNALEQAVMQAGDQLGHHAEVERRPDGMRLVLWTHSEGGVTEQDVELAARLDQVLSGSGRDRHATS